MERITINDIPAVIYGKPSDKVYLYVHGKSGYKEEAEDFARLAGEYGWQTLSADLPGHGERKADIDRFDPWDVVPELRELMKYIRKNWSVAALRANSIGAWFSLLAFAQEDMENSLFVSPVTDMKALIEKMMTWAGVDADMLREKGRIATSFGETLSWKYYSYVCENPIREWSSPLSILCAGRDDLTDRDAFVEFSRRFSCRLTIMEEGEHWFHTAEQLEFLQKWTTDELERY